MWNFNYYSQFVNRYAEIAAPFFELTGGKKNRLSGLKKLTMRSRA